jgi:hypothetical protein
MEADLPIFFGELSNRATYCPQGQTCRDVVCHLFIEAAVDTVYYVLYIKSDDVPEISVRDTFVIDGITYSVTDYEFDEHKLLLVVTLNRSTNVL